RFHHRPAKGLAHMRWRDEEHRVADDGVDVIHGSPAEPFDGWIVARGLEYIVAHRAIADDLQRQLAVKFFPRRQQCRDAFFGRKPANEDRVISAGASPGIGIDEMRLGGDLLSFY